MSFFENSIVLFTKRSSGIWVYCVLCIYIVVIVFTIVIYIGLKWGRGGRGRRGGRGLWTSMRHGQLVEFVFQHGSLEIGEKGKTVGSVWLHA